MSKRHGGDGEFWFSFSSPTHTSTTNILQKKCFLLLFLDCKKRMGIRTGWGRDEDGWLKSTFFCPGSFIPHHPLTQTENNLMYTETWIHSFLHFPSRLLEDKAAKRILLTPNRRELEKREENSGWRVMLLLSQHMTVSCKKKQIPQGIEKQTKVTCLWSKDLNNWMGRKTVSLVFLFEISTSIPTLSLWYCDVWVISSYNTRVSGILIQHLQTHPSHISLSGESGSPWTAFFFLSRQPFRFILLFFPLPYRHTNPVVRFVLFPVYPFWSILWFLFYWFLIDCFFSPKTSPFCLSVWS